MTNPYLNYPEWVLYFIVGGFTTIINWLLYILLVWLGLEINFSNAFSWIGSTFFAFVMNKWFVFQSRSLDLIIIAREIGSFFIARIFTGIIAIVLFPIVYMFEMNWYLFWIDGFISKVLTSFVEIVLNWILSKYLIFIKNEE